MNSLQTFYSELQFQLSNFTWADGLDWLLVTLVFYLLLNLVRHSRAALLLRSALTLTVILFIITIIFPLPTFNWLVRVSVVAILVSIPIVFQPELRRRLDRMGQNVTTLTTMTQTSMGQALPALVQAVDQLAATQTGALIALQGNDVLQTATETGIPLGSQVTSELLQAVFYSGNPLHDGGVIIKQDKLVAAGCVFPLTQRPLTTNRRLGTRHRAAVGLSSTSDALLIVVSEETGEISVARNGYLEQDVSGPALQAYLLDFAAVPSQTNGFLLLPHMVGQAMINFWKKPHLPTPAQIFAGLSFLIIAAMLAMATRSFVLEQTNPIRQARIEDVTLHLENIPPETTLITSPPSTVSALIQTTDSVLPSLRPASFQAAVSLEGLPPGLHRLPVQIISGASEVRILSADPPVLDIELAPIITRTLPVIIDLPEDQNLPPAYEMVGLPLARPNQTEITGAAPLVEQISQVQAAISLNNAANSFRTVRPLRALDENGREITGLSLQPPQTEIDVTIRRRLNALDVGIRPVTTGSPSPDYWLNSLEVIPANVTLQSSPEQLAKINGFVETLPVDISQADGDITIAVPLNLPADVQVFDSEGNVAKTVIVSAKITPRNSDIVVSRQVELINLSPTITRTVNAEPGQVEVLLSGPLPILNRIKAEPDLVRVLADAAHLAAGQNADLPLTVIAPNNVQAQLAPSSVLVTIP